MCEAGPAGAAWQREGSTLVGRRARSSKKQQGKRDGFIAAWCSSTISSITVCLDDLLVPSAQLSAGTDAALISAPTYTLSSAPADIVLLSASMTDAERGHDAQDADQAATLITSPLEMVDEADVVHVKEDSGGNSHDCGVGSRGGSVGETGGRKQEGRGGVLEASAQPAKKIRREEKVVLHNAEIVEGLRVKALWKWSEGGERWYTGTVSSRREKCHVLVHEEALCVCVWVGVRNRSLCTMLSLGG